MATNSLVYLDTCASHHMTGDISKVSFLTKLETPMKIKTGNGYIYLEYAGTTYFKPNHGTQLPIALENTVFNPHSTVNILSYGKLTNKCEFEHKNEEIKVYSKNTGKHLFTARKTSSDVFIVGTQVDFTHDTGDQHPQFLALHAMINNSGTVNGVLLHRRLAHVGYSTLVKMHKMNILDGLGVTRERLEECLHGPKCDACMAGKLTKLPHYPSRSLPRNNLHVDVCQIEYTILGGKKYMAVALHEITDYSFVALIEKKEEAGRFTREIMQFVNTQTSQKITGLRSDNGGEYVNETVGTWLAERGIHHEYTIPYTPQQNGKAERLNRTLQEMARCVLDDSSNPNWLWGEAIMCVNYIRNITVRSRKGIVPYTQFWGREPTYASLRIFGCKAYVLIPKEKRKSKMDSVCEVGMMVGYPTQASGYRILLEDSSGKYVVKAKRDVIFDETMVGADKCMPRRKRGRSMSPHERPTATGPGPAVPSVEIEFGVGDGGGSTGEPGATPTPSPPRVRRIGPPVRGRSWGTITRIRDTALITMYDRDGEEYTCLMNTDENATENDEMYEPLSVEEALSSPQAVEWERALNAEMASLTANNTWEVIDCPQGVKPIPCKWVLKIKRNEIGEIVRYKARLVAKGFRQIPGVDFTEISSPVVRLSTVRTIFAMACANNWKLHHLDTDTAFLHGHLRESIYMEPPEGFEFGDKVLKLNKCLYGLKQAPLVWYETLKAKFESEGFVISYADASLLTLWDEKGKSFAVIYVDDQILTGPNDELNEKIKALLLKEFPGKDLGEAQFFVGMRLERDFAKKTLKISQTRHIDDLLKAFGQEASNPVKVPMDGALDLTSDGSDLYPNPQRYMSLVGSLNYLSMCTRPDITYATSLLCRYMSKPTQNHYNAAIRVLRYLKGTRNYGITYGNKSSNPPNLQMVAYSDANFAEKEDGVSVYGYAFMLNDAAVHWASRKQNKVAKNTADAEFVAASKTTDEALWMNKLLADCSLPRPIAVYMDNTAAIVQVREMPARNKYIRVHYLSVFERIRNSDIVFEHIPSNEMIADIFTKPLAYDKFQYFRNALGVCE
jgi:hypothetical protein